MWEKILRPFLSLYIIGAIGEASEPKCIKAGCDNKQASGSSYCYLHKPYTGHSSYGSSTGSKSSTTKSTSSSSYSGSSSSSSKKTGTSSGSSSSYSTKSHSSSNKSNPYASYDSGYDSIYDDGDYDWNRYQKDKDYADGVDDAMEELDEDW
ncbi:hypothetical protein [Lachnospira eligens]|jgi:hypothetical protein|nr:hypothetical protein [Lachnospira eligens]RGT56866.1 hypothetical protein DWX21_02090 [Lachnospira eligens]RGZ72107.1 hypothetical protein DW976_04295 [Lachnospira eligens]RHC15308.1 hypothetical protein DW858_00260 [Lachnospira eligens]